MNYHLLFLGLRTKPRTPTTKGRQPINRSQGLACNFLEMFVDARLLGRQALVGVQWPLHCGARAPLCKISFIQNNA